MLYLVLFFQNGSSSPKDISKRHILHWSGASELLTLVSNEVLLDWEVIAKSISSLIRLFAMHELFTGSWSFHLLEDAAEPSPLSPLVDVTPKQKHLDIHAFVSFRYNNSQCQYKQRQQSPPLGGISSSLPTMLLPPIARWASIFTYPHRPPSMPFIKSHF